MSASRLEYLFDCYVHNSCTEEEERELMVLLAQSENEPLVQALIGKVVASTHPEMQMPDQRAAFILQEILENNRAGPLPHEARIGFRPWMRVAAAALLFMLGAGYWYFGSAPAKLIAAAASHSSIRPMETRALLTMSDGKTIVLDNTNTTTLQYGGVKIRKNGMLLVFDTASADRGPVLYNTFSTPPGSQYELILPDGSKVWLNAGSSIRFPSRFVGPQRQVSITGEAYFEVTKNKHKPFQVVSGNMSVNVLGTHFNINAYGDDGMIRTSLLEGSVRIERSGVSNILKPGQQAIVNNRYGGIEMSNINIEQVMAWKDGLFQFEGADIKIIMAEIGRWYDVQIEYAGRVPLRRFEGKISRSAQLSDVLQILELSNVKFSLNGRKITVE